MQIDPLSPVNASHDELVRERAYEIYEHSGRQRGHELEHWLEAERELTDVQRHAPRTLLV